MSDDEDGGEHTNAQYYSATWTKPKKVRLEPKKAKVNSKQLVIFCDVLVGTVEHLGRLHDKRKHTSKCPLGR